MKLLQTLLLSAATVYATNSLALPSLQLGGDGSDAWSYDTTDETWIASGTSNFELYTYANCESGTAGCTDPNGDFAWDSLGADDRFAYLTIAGTPDIGDNPNAFDVSVIGASLVDTGYGKAPLQDANSVSPHSIYDTYFEIYEFQFDGPIQTIGNTQPGDTGTGSGYIESFGITINALFEGVTGLHFDLFTVNGGQWDPNNTDTDKWLVNAVAPYSHDAAVTIPEPGILVLLGIGLVGFSLRRYNKTR